MVNWANKQRAISPSNEPHYVHYITPRLSDRPWMPSAAEHASSRTSWVSHAERALRTTSPISTIAQCFTLFRIGFIFAAEPCEPCAKFAGIDHQMSNLPIAHNLAITDIVGVARAFRRVLTGAIQERDRRRHAGIPDFTDLLTPDDFAVGERARREIFAAVKKTNAAQ